MAVDIEGVTQAVAGLPLVGNEEGLIPAFNVYLTRHYADYYNRVSFAYLHRAEAEGAEAGAAAAARLTESGHICGFNTFGGIMLSPEWEAVVMPQVETREDWVAGIVGVINALGWGTWSIEKLVAGEELVIRCPNPYEASGYLRDYPVRDAGTACFLALGGTAAIMNLLYHGDITTRPALDEAYYAETFVEGADRFVAKATQCTTRGDPVCEWRAVRQSKAG